MSTGSLGIQGLIALVKQKLVLRFALHTISIALLVLLIPQQCGYPCFHLLVAF